jgi:hypothetical protein
MRRKIGLNSPRIWGMSVENPVLSVRKGSLLSSAALGRRAGEDYKQCKMTAQMNGRSARARVLF